MDKSKLMTEVKDILRGIDELETDSEDGWWETSAGSEFGLRKLVDVLLAIAEAE